MFNGLVCFVFGFSYLDLVFSVGLLLECVWVYGLTFCLVVCFCVRFLLVTDFGFELMRWLLFIYFGCFWLLLLVSLLDFATSLGLMSVDCDCLDGWCLFCVAVLLSFIGLLVLFCCLLSGVCCYFAFVAVVSVVGMGLIVYCVIFCLHLKLFGGFSNVYLLYPFEYCCFCYVFAYYEFCFVRFVV